MLGAYLWSLNYNNGSWDGGDTKLMSEGVKKARTVTCMVCGRPPCAAARSPAALADSRLAQVIVFAELMRAYGARSLRASIFQLVRAALRACASVCHDVVLNGFFAVPQGVFSNPWMQPAVMTSISATLIMVLVPTMQDIFGFSSLDGKQWGFVIGG